jgi:glycosyltransferase involved in cell wall biosynthesis
MVIPNMAMLIRFRQKTPWWANIGMTRPLRLLHISETVKGGIGTYLDQVIPELDTRIVEGRPLDQFALVPAGSEDYLPSVRCDKILKFASARRRNPFEMVRLAGEFRQFIRQTQPDIVFLHSTFAGALVRTQRWFLGVGAKFIYCAHGPAYDAQWHPLTKSLITGFERLMAQRTDWVVALSNQEVTDCAEAGFPTDRISRVYNGIAEQTPAAVPALWDERRLKVLFVGRFDHQKGLDTLLAAAAMAPDRLTVRCAGEAVVSTALPAGAGDNVEFLGWLGASELHAQLLAADVLVMPSRWEGLGIAAIEAMRAGKPVVAWRTEGSGC